MIIYDRMESYSKHTILLVICCLIPIIGIAILAASGAIGSWGYYGLILLCPLGHFVIISLMNHNVKSNGQYEQNDNWRGSS